MFSENLTGFSRTLTALVAFLVLVGSGAASAGDLTADEAKRFASSLAGTSDFRKSLEESGHTSLMNDAFQPKPGETFNPFVSAIGKLKETVPEKHAELESLIKPHGFASAEAWGTIGDRVILAYIALELTSNPQMMSFAEQLTPEMLDQMPPEARPQLETLMGILNQVQKTSEQDREVVRAIKPELQAVLDLPKGMGGMPGR